MDHIRLCVAVVFLLVCPLNAALLSNIFGENMVLQRAPSSARLWGWSVAGDTVTIAFNNQKYSAETNGSGWWGVALPPTEAGGPYTLALASANNASNTQTFTNVLFGDVYLCGGQSNMQFTVNAVFNASEALEEANNYPLIRLFTVGQGSQANTPAPELITIEQTWSVANAASLGNSTSSFNYFSAVCWFYGLNIQKNNPKLPIGLISSNWGGTQIQSWSSTDVFDECPQPSSSISHPNKHEISVGDGSGSLYNAMIVPFIGLPLTGFLWYQGEANVGQTDYYRCLFPAMISDWRAKWGIGNIPFLFVQLSPYNTDGPLPEWNSLPDMRLAQESALVLPNVAMAVIVDLGDTGSPFTNIHPRNKQDVGYRLWLAGSSIIYGQDVIYQGPTYVSSTVFSTNPPTVLVNFLSTTVGTGLQFEAASCPLPEFCAWWEIGLSDGTWQNATAAIVDNVAVSVSLPSVTSAVNVTGVRYLYGDWPVATLFNSAGLPAGPFYNTFI